MGFLELTGARRGGSGSPPIYLTTRRTALALCCFLAVTCSVSVARAAAVAPHPTDLACIDACAGRQTVAVGSKIRITGDELRQVKEVEFRGRSGRIAARPAVSGRHRLSVEVPSRARSGRPRVVARGGQAARVSTIVRIVSQARLPDRNSFDLLDADVGPKRGFVDDGRTYRLRYRFRAYGSQPMSVKLLHSGTAARRWNPRQVLPYTRHVVRWRGTLAHGHPATPGHYRFKITARHHRPVLTDKFRLFSGKFPVRGPHNYGGAEQRFGAPRSGGRVHQGQDVFSPCGTRVVAARGGRVQARGSDPVLYGNWAVIDARGTQTDYRYAHFLHPATVHDGERVRTGREIGRIGKTGNARSVGCQLHFEVWPQGWEHGSPVDPLPILKRWDGWS